MKHLSFEVSKGITGLTGFPTPSYKGPTDDVAETISILGEIAQREPNTEARVDIEGGVKVIGNIGDVIGYFQKVRLESECEEGGVPLAGPGWGEE